MLVIIIILQTCWWWCLFHCRRCLLLVVLVWCFRSQQMLAPLETVAGNLNTSPGNPSIISTVIGKAEPPTRAKLATKAICCPHFPRPSWHQWKPDSTRRDQCLHWPGCCSSVKGSRGLRQGHPLWGSWQSIQVKQDQGGACFGPENPLAPAHGRWEQGVPQMIQWVACFPLSRCQKCLSGTG